MSFSNLLVNAGGFTLLAKFSDNTSEPIIGSIPELTLLTCEACVDYVYGTDLFINGDCECDHLTWASESQLTEQTAASCGQGFKISGAGVCTNWLGEGAAHSGKFMYINYKGADVYVWRQSIPRSYFLPNKPYQFKMWFKRRTGDFTLTMKVDGVAIQTQTINATNNPDDVWFEMNGSWTSPAVPQTVDVEVYYHCNNPAVDTYFALDDFMFRYVAPCNNVSPQPTTIPYVNPCIKNLQEIAKTNATESYNAYIKGIKTQFRDNYVNTCKNALENLKMMYPDKEHQITLYYYDQAGNLIKTVPPEGVKLITAAGDLDKIKDDRYNKTQTFFTSHTLKTRYEYNALNQLIRQATPDQDLTNKWQLTGYTPVSPSAAIYGISFSTADKGVMVGDDGSGTKGAIYITNDGGKTWNRVSTMQVGNLQDVQYIDTTGYAITDKGELVKRLGTAPWSQVATPLSGQQLNDLHFFSATAGIIIGNNGVILKTTNSGGSWTTPTVNASAIPGGIVTAVNFNDIYFTDASNGFIAGSKGVVLRTTDGGTTWNALPGVSNPLNVNVNLNGIHFLSSTLGYAVGVNTINGQGVIAKAVISAGGTITTWSYPPLYPALMGEFKSIAAGDTNTVFAGGTGGNLYRRSPGNPYFVKETITGMSGTPEISELHFPSTNLVSNPGYGILKNGQLLKSSYASGINWNALNITSGALTNPPLNGLYFESTTNGYVAGDARVVLKTTDGGSTWNNLSITGYEPPLALEDVYMVKGTSTGYAVGKGGRIEKTTNDGTSWATVSSGTTNDLKAIVCEDANTGIIVGASGTIRKLSSGTTVTAIATSPAVTNSFNDLIQLPTTPGSYITVGSTGKIIKGTSGTSPWTSNAITSGTANDLNAVYAVNDTVYAAGANGTILKSKDAGASWRTLTSGTTAILRELYFKDELSGYALGDGGMILKTIDGGLNWKQQPSGSSNFYAGVFNANGTAILTGTAGSGNNMNQLSDESSDYSTRFWYDRLGRMVLSQNTKQYNKSPKAYSYTIYDALGRITEVGEASNNTDITAMVNIHGVVYNDAAFKTWLTAAARKEVTTTTYDAPVNHTVSNFTQENLRSRVSAVYIDDDGNSINGYTHASIYSYDMHGNVKTLIQEIPDLKTDNQRYKRIDYEYDLISGNVNQVSYQKGQNDAFYHKYEYDAENRITKAFTSNNGYIWDEDAKYFYYDHGPLARVELGNDKVQGLDYVYTLQGWIKGVNSNTLNTTRDPGKDGTTGTLYNGYAADIHAKTARDIYGYSLNYFDRVTGQNNHDYYAISATNNATANDFEADASASPGYLTDAPNLFNGNIKRMITTITDIQIGSPTIGQALPQLTSYKYDQLNRIVQMKAYRDINISTNISGAATSSAYQSTMSYDANGNILTMNVNGNVTTPNMDQLTYKYDWIDPANPSKGKRSNRLYHVNDNPSYTANYTTDIDDQGTFTPAPLNNLTQINTANNYGYDELGNLKRDNQEQISNIDWTVYGKIKSIARTGGSTKPTLDFTYDAQGNRLSKKTTDASGTKTNYYVRDASGNIMAIYEKNCNGNCTFKALEYSLYGSSRVGTQTAYATEGIWQNSYLRIRKNKSYELTNHLQNVLTVITDKRVAHSTNGTTIDYYLADAVNTSDYAVFGGSLNGRGYSSSVKYNYGFNGKLKDDEVSGNGNSYDYGFRIYNPRLGKFFSTDPLIKKYPMLTPYQFASNTPIQAIDLDGLEAVYYFVVYSKSAGIQTAKLNHKDMAERSHISMFGEQHGKMGTGELVVYINADNSTGTISYVPSMEDNVKKFFNTETVVFGDEKTNAKNTGTKSVGGPYRTVDLSEIESIVDDVTGAYDKAADKLKARNIDPTKGVLDKANETKDFVEDTEETQGTITKIEKKGDRVIYSEDTYFGKDDSTQKVDNAQKEGKAVKVYPKKDK